MTSFMQHCRNNRASLQLNQETLQTFEQKAAELLSAESGGASAGGGATASFTPAASSFSAKREPDQVVFEKFLQTLFEGLAPLGASKIGPAFGGVSSSGVSSQFGDAIVAWSKNLGAFTTAGLPPIDVSRMEKLVNYLYGQTCNLIGPIKTDQLFLRAVQRADALPEAISFSPKRFL